VFGRRIASAHTCAILILSWYPLAFRDRGPNRCREVSAEACRRRHGDSADGGSTGLRPRQSHVVALLLGLPQYDRIPSYFAYTAERNGHVYCNSNIAVYSLWVMKWSVSSHRECLLYSDQTPKLGSRGTVSYYSRFPSSICCLWDQSLSDMGRPFRLNLSYCLLMASSCTIVSYIQSHFWAEILHQ
jgi:hypothetical protein